MITKNIIIKFKLVITNKTSEQQKARILYPLNVNEENFGLPDGVSLELQNKEITYNALLDHISKLPCLMKFTSSTSNRQLFFGYQDESGCEYPIEPQKNIDGTLRERNSSDNIYDDFFTNKWNPREWNIADTHEIPIWTFLNFIDLHLNPKQVFALEFEIVKNGMDEIMESIKSVYVKLTLVDNQIEIDPEIQKALNDFKPKNKPKKERF